MAITKVNGLFCGNNKNSINNQFVMDCQSHVKSIAWFAQMTRDGKLNSNEVNDVFSKLEDFLDEKEFEKAEIVAELQLAYAFQNVLKEKQAELINSVGFKS